MGRFLTIIIIAWGMQPIKEILNSAGQIQFEFAGLHNTIRDTTGKMIPHIFKFNFLSAAGTAILIASLISIPLIGLQYRTAGRIFLSTVKQLTYPIITIASILGFAYVVNDSGISITIAEALAKTGFLFPFFAPVLGWLGVFITGSDTSSNALFGKLQSATATSIGIDPVLTVAANTSGGVIGKMISPQSIAVAAAAGDLVGRESELFRFTVKHSFIMLIFICFVVFAQAYWITWIIPEYHMLQQGATSLGADLSKSYIYLAALALILIVLALTIKRSSRSKASLKKGGD